ncbi:hypothetical protein C8Q70DRAFT_877180, partial [Cubamyces menziesii]
VRITKEGESIRLLGARIGNGVDQDGVWEPLLARMQKNLDRWAKADLSMHGKKLVIGMEVGGRTQFFARAQGMSKSVLASVERMIWKFVW